LWWGSLRSIHPAFTTSPEKVYAMKFPIMPRIAATILFAALCGWSALGWGATASLSSNADSIVKHASPGNPGANAANQQVWLISSRQALCVPPALGGEAMLGYWFLGPDNQWVPASLGAFLATDDAAVPTVIFFHGNRVDANRAVCDGWLVLTQLTALAQGRPFRFVIFSWPADRLDGGQRDDVQCKAVRSDAQSYYAAWLINRMHPGVPLDLIGFSFGARVVTGALELLGGGCLAGQVLPDRTPDPRPIRAMLVAAALDSDWLLPAHRDGLALGQVERMLVSVDPRDRAMHFYPRLYGRGGPEALGACGPDCPEQLGAQAVKLELVDVQCEVGKVHDWTNYASACSLMSRLGWYAFLP
jgi:hypothetical protein